MAPPHVPATGEAVVAHTAPVANECIEAERAGQRLRVLQICAVGPEQPLARTNPLVVRDVAVVVQQPVVRCCSGSVECGVAEGVELNRGRIGSVESAPRAEDHVAASVLDLQAARVDAVGVDVLGREVDGVDHVRRDARRRDVVRTQIHRRDRVRAHAVGGDVAGDDLVRVERRDVGVLHVGAGRHHDAVDRRRARQVVERRAVARCRVRRHRSDAELVGDDHELAGRRRVVRRRDEPEAGDVAVRVDLDAVLALDAVDRSRLGGDRRRRTVERRRDPVHRVGDRLVLRGPRRLLRRYRCRPVGVIADLRPVRVLGRRRDVWRLGSVLDALPELAAVGNDVAVRVTARMLRVERRVRQGGHLHLQIRDVRAAVLDLEQQAAVRRRFVERRRVDQVEARVEVRVQLALGQRPVEHAEHVVGVGGCDAVRAVDRVERAGCAGGRDELDPVIPARVRAHVVREVRARRLRDEHGIAQAAAVICAPDLGVRVVPVRHDRIVPLEDDELERPCCQETGRHRRHQQAQRRADMDVLAGGDVRDPGVDEVALRREAAERRSGSLLEPVLDRGEEVVDALVAGRRHGWNLRQLSAPGGDGLAGGDFEGADGVRHPSAPPSCWRRCSSSTGRCRRARTRTTRSGSRPAAGTAPSLSPSACA